jgi:hypothetical protein
MGIEKTELLSFQWTDSIMLSFFVWFLVSEKFLDHPVQMVKIVFFFRNIFLGL